MSTTPVIIYSPGLGNSPSNSADTLADIIAETADRLSPGAKFATKNDPTLSAPAGIKVSKTIIDEHGQAVLQVFQFDYGPILTPTTATPTPHIVPGMIRSAAYAVKGALMLLAAFKRPAKGAMTKLQLWIGFLAVLLLIFVALIAVYSLLQTANVPVPNWWILDENAAPRTLGITSLGLVITWSALRTKLLAVAGTTQYLMRFVHNEDSVADSISVKLDNALDGLADSGWDGEVHLLGYSFGSLTVFEAMCPRRLSGRSPRPVQRLTSAVTVGLPLDIVRLYLPSYVDDRTARRPNLPWTNLFNRADMFASNLQDKDDARAGSSTLVTDQPIASVQYTDQKLGWFQIFTAGRMHTSYWSKPQQAHCFEELVPNWLPALRVT